MIVVEYGPTLDKQCCNDLLVLFVPNYGANGTSG